MPPIKVGLTDEEASYCSSKNRPALDAVGVVTDLVVVRVSNTKAAYDSFVDRGVEENERNDDSRCDRIVVLPEPLSPLLCRQSVNHERGTLNSLGVHLQKDYGLVLPPGTQTSEGASCQVLRLGHGTALLPTIWALGGRRVGVDAY